MKRTHSRAGKASCAGGTDGGVGLYQTNPLYALRHFGRGVYVGVRNFLGKVRKGVCRCGMKPCVLTEWGVVEVKHEAGECFWCGRWRDE